MDDQKNDEGPVSVLDPPEVHQQWRRAGRDLPSKDVQAWQAERRSGYGLN
jgi:hypothetical protein